MSLQSSIDYGYPNLIDPPWFGVWCPLLDCFLMVHYNYGQLQRLQTLTMHKILTVILPLNTSLYENHIIDNTCASKWTVVNPEFINFTMILKEKFLKSTVDIMPIEVIDTTEVDRVQAWMLFVWKWLTYIDTTLVDLHHEFGAYILGMAPDQKLLPIYQILLIEQDPVLAELQIQQVLDSYV
jgi:hypothetical protein